MIRVAPTAAALTPAERYGLDTLLDLSRLLRVEDPAGPAVTLTLVPESEPEAAVAAGVAGVGRGDGEVRLARSVLLQVTAIAGAGAEQVTGAADRHGRVPAAENALVRAGTERRPVVSELARRLRQAVCAVAGRRPVRLLLPWPEGRRWAAAFTHDVDVLAGWPAFTLLRLVELVRAGEGGRAARVLGAAIRAVTRSPTVEGIAEVLRLEAAHGIRSTWFFLCGTPTLSRWWAGDVTYDVGSPTGRMVVHAVRGGGHELAVHGTFATGRAPEAFAAERRRLAAVAGAAGAAGIRQHFLKMRPGATQRDMRAGGFEYDATYGFADRNGFRLGVADVVRGWDAAAGAVTELDEVPLMWMDRAQSKYQRVEDPRQWVAEARELVTRCREVEGLWVGLWHPNLTAPLGFPGAPAAYADLVGGIVNGDGPPAVDTLEQLVAWRRRRRGARARRIGADGRLDWASPAVPLEDGEGRTVA